MVNNVNLTRWRRQTCGHACEALSWLGHLRWKWAGPFPRLGCWTGLKREKQWSRTAPVLCFLTRDATWSIASNSYPKDFPPWWILNPQLKETLSSPSCFCQGIFFLSQHSQQLRHSWMEIQKESSEPIFYNAWGGDWEQILPCFKSSWGFSFLKWE